MKKDIPQLKVEDLAIAIVPKDNEFWESYIINLKEEPIKNVLIKSSGYGEKDGKSMKTSVLRHFFEVIGPLEIKKIENVPVDLFHLTNEYWVSFNFEDYMYDKKYLFVKGSLDKMNFTPIPFLNKQGVMIR